MFRFTELSPLLSAALNDRYRVCVQLNETFSITRKMKANFPFICDNFQRRVANIPLLFSSCLLAAYANKLYVCLLCNQNLGVFIALILFVSIYNFVLYSLFDSTSSLVYENNR